MILADTNVVVDFCGVTAARTRRAQSVKSAIPRGERLVITEAVLAECFWVLRQSYGWSDRDSADVLADIADSTEFAAENGYLRVSLTIKRSHPSLDIADCLLAARVLDGDDLITHDARLNRAIELEMRGPTQ
ncbi:MAG: PIN domain-containing protein [Coriobacteriia bacterium]|nr:PIN domain-containing protein [Coriobacteriia bacterium]